MPVRCTTVVAMLMRYFLWHLVAYFTYESFPKVCTRMSYSLLQP